jgi:hypothetical protein
MPRGIAPKEGTMERRGGSRALVDVPVSAFVDGHRHACRAIDVSPTGMLYERTRSLATRLPYELGVFELRLGGLPIPLRARTVWIRDRLHAVRFVVVHDVDRLAIAEHVDAIARLGVPSLLH